MLDTLEPNDTMGTAVKAIRPCRKTLWLLEVKARAVRRTHHVQCSRGHSDNLIREAGRFTGTRILYRFVTCV
jgi:hypothetical protein